ncbi:hypothetical protein GCM10022244_51850 [Streptomyces gulbargensis]|uniref:DUF4190 domain-containing protein n=1 Tax=Streptomyces gulbargensis TaxID=364901 RepID=A0ABP7N804_9ACTN
MSDNRHQQPGGFDPADPWAPPNRDGVELSKGSATSPVHDQPTVTSMPSAGGPAADVPPPPVAPGGPAAAPGAYGYPAPASAPAAPPGPSYGYPPAYGYGTQPGWGARPANGMGITAMVLGIVAVAGFCFWGLGVVLGIMALVFGVIGMKKANRGEATNRGMALAGVILGSIGIVISGAFLGFLIWSLTQDSSSSGYDEDPFPTSLSATR